MLIYGHRGACVDVRPNTVEAYGLAVGQGADGVELDVRRTRDDAIIIFHDDRLAPDATPFAEMDFSEIKTTAPWIPTLDEAWDALSPNALLNIEIKNIYGQADYVITTGESVREKLADSGLVPLDRSMSIPTGVDLERFRPDSGDRAEARGALGVAGDGPVIGVVAYLRQDKGHAVLLQALPEILESFPQCSLVVVGDGPERFNLEALAGHLGIERSVRFVGLREDIPLVLAGFDIFCQPSLRNEGVPQSVLQAGAVARPVVSTEVGGIPEAVVHGETGFLVPPDDADALAEGIAALLADRELRNRLGEAGRRHVSGAFSVQRMIDRTELAYAAALRSAASRGGTVSPDPAVL